MKNNKKAVANLFVTVILILIVVVAVTSIGVIIINTSHKLNSSIAIQEIQQDCKAKNPTNSQGYSDCVVAEANTQGISSTLILGQSGAQQNNNPVPQPQGGQQSSRSAVRTLPLFYLTGFPVQAKINITFDSQDCGAAVEEHLPVGWNASNITGAGGPFYSAKDNTIRWGIIDGPLCGGQTNYILTYTTIANASTFGIANFSGIFSVDGTDYPITGSSNIINLSSGGQSVNLNAPSNLTSFNVSYNKVSLSWIDNSNNEQGFRVEYARSGVRWYLGANVSKNVTSISFPPTLQGSGIGGGAYYWFRVYAYNASSISTYANLGWVLVPWNPSYVCGDGVKNPNEDCDYAITGYGTSSTPVGLCRDLISGTTRYPDNNVYCNQECGLDPTNCF